MTYDAYWDMRDENTDRSTGYNYNNLWDKNSLSSTYSLNESNAKEPEKAFKSIGPRVNKREWKAAKEQIGTDVTFKVLNQEFHAHKIKLMANSDYFHKMFSTPMSEGLHPDNVIELKEMDPLIFKILLKFIYTGTIGKTIQANFAKDVSGLIQVMEKAEYLQIDGIVQWSTELVRYYLDTNKHPGEDIVLSLLSFALKACDKELLEVLIKAFTNPGSGQLDILVQWINRASVEGLITKKNWKLLCDVCLAYPRSVGMIIENCAKYNPLIISVLE